MNDTHDLELLLRSRFPLIVIETHEEGRVLSILEKLANLSMAVIRVVSGGRSGPARLATRIYSDCQDPALALRHIGKTSRTDCLRY